MEVEDSVAENMLVSKVTGPIHDRTESSVMKTPISQGICALGTTQLSSPGSWEHRREGSTIDFPFSIAFDGTEE
jgi:hypothetical protein